MVGTTFVMYVYVCRSDAGIDIDRRYGIRL